MTEDAKDYLVDALKTELDSALRTLTMTLIGTKSQADAAWWLCANHARFIIEHPNLNAETPIVAMAARGGPPPRGENWRDWFDRVRNLRPLDILRRL